MKMSLFLRTVATAALLGGCAALTFAAPTTQPLKPYPLKTCIVSDEALGGDMGDPIVSSYNGQEIKFCCNSCPKKFAKDPAKYMKKLEAATPTTKPAM